MSPIQQNIHQFITQYWLILTSIVLVLISLGSLLPAPELPKVPGTDKTHHFIAYCALMLPAALARPKHWLYIALAFVLYSGVIELIQPYVNRYGEWLDLLANLGGIVIAILFSLIWRYFLNKNTITS